MNQEIHIGYDTTSILGSLLRKKNPRTIFLVTGKKSYIVSGAQKALAPCLANFTYTHFSEFEINPKCKDVIKGSNLLKQNRCDFVIGIGGGSVLDMAKAVAFMSSQTKSLDDVLIDKHTSLPRTIPCVVIPTTAGTGSESTHFSVLYKNKIKYSLAHKSMLPDVVLLDPSFLSTLPAYIKAHTSMDALCQAIEAFWSVRSTEDSKKYSTQAITHILKYIHSYIYNSDPVTNENMLLASNYAGKAINIARTTAAHSVSYPLTSYFNIPHGHAVALTIPSFFRYNNNVTTDTLQDSRGVDFVKKSMHKLASLFGVTDTTEAGNKLETLMQDTNLETRLSKLNIHKNDIDTIVQHGFSPERIIYNPRKLTEEDLRTLLFSIL